MPGIIFENMSDKLVEAVPELRPAYEKELAWWGGEEAGAHNIYGELLNPYLISLLTSVNLALLSDKQRNPRRGSA